ncbi:hypothetical protein ECNE037_3516, partial [Escherichia coli NE037]
MPYDIRHKLWGRTEVP